MLYYVFFISLVKIYWLCDISCNKQKYIIQKFCAFFFLYTNICALKSNWFLYLLNFFPTVQTLQYSNTSGNIQEQFIFMSFICFLNKAFCAVILILPTARKISHNDWLAWTKLMYVFSLKFPETKYLGFS
jgi:hypothetical protein